MMLTYSRSMIDSAPWHLQCANQEGEPVGMAERAPTEEIDCTGCGYPV